MNGIPGSSGFRGSNVGSAASVGGLASTPTRSSPAVAAVEPHEFSELTVVQKTYAKLSELALQVLPLAEEKREELETELLSTFANAGTDLPTDEALVAAAQPAGLELLTLNYARAEQFGDNCKLTGERSVLLPNGVRVSSATDSLRLVAPGEPAISPKNHIYYRKNAPEAPVEVAIITEDKEGNRVSTTAGKWTSMRFVEGPFVYSFSKESPDEDFHVVSINFNGLRIVAPETGDESSLQVLAEHGEERLTVLQAMKDLATSFQCPVEERYFQVVVQPHKM